ncbi:MAG: 50S ribosomal protein L31e [Nanoarchaeota archaeon]
MTELKREYVVPLRRKIRTAPKWRRSKKAVSVLKEFIKKHMKTDSVIICKELNEAIWERGIKSPPGKVSVVALKFEHLKEEKTLVNLLSVGVDKYIDSYKSQETVSQVEDSKREESAEKKEKVETKDVEKEDKVETKDEKKVETKDEKKVDEKDDESNKKSTKKKEVVQNG